MELCDTDKCSVSLCLHSQYCVESIHCNFFVFVYSLLTKEQKITAYQSSFRHHILVILFVLWITVALWVMCDNCVRAMTVHGHCASAKAEQDTEHRVHVNTGIWRPRDYVTLHPTCGIHTQSNTKPREILWLLTVFMRLLNWSWMAQEEDEGGRGERKEQVERC